MAPMAVKAGTPGRDKTPSGIFRDALAGQGQCVAQVFDNLGRTPKASVIAEDDKHGIRAACMTLCPDEGHGRIEFYRVSNDLFVVAVDCIWDAPRLEFLPGENLIEFYFKLSGRLVLKLPGEVKELVVTGQQLLIWAQPTGVDTSERMEPGLRDTSVSLYCRPDFLRGLLERDAMNLHPLIDALDALASRRRNMVWHRVQSLSQTAVHIIRCLLHNPHREGLRLLYAEARALELLCEILSDFGNTQTPRKPEASDRDLLCLDAARRYLATHFQPIPRICDVARAVGLSETKLKRDFKRRFGVTVFDFGLECRMRHARELLLNEGMYVSEVAFAVGYSHCTSFTAAFREFFGYQPSELRSERGDTRS